MTRYASAQDAARAAAEAAQRIRSAKSVIEREEPVLADARRQFDAFLDTAPGLSVPELGEAQRQIGVVANGSLNTFDEPAEGPPA